MKVKEDDQRCEEASLRGRRQCGSLPDGQEMAEREGAGNATDLCKTVQWLNRKGMFPVSLKSRTGHAEQN